MSGVFRVALLLTTLLAGSAANAALLARAGITATVTEYGRYDLQETQQQQPAIDSTAGFSSVVDARLLEQDHEIPLQLGAVFGFRFAISDLSAQTEWLPLEVHVRHPPITDHRGETRHGFVMQSAAHLEADGRYHNAAYYILSQPRELAAGDWQIAIFYRGQRLLSRTFLLH